MTWPFRRRWRVSVCCGVSRRASARQVGEHLGAEELHLLQVADIEQLEVDALRAESPQALEQLLGQIHSVPGVKGTKSFIALSTFLDRPVQAEVTETWPDFPMPE